MSDDQAARIAELEQRVNDLAHENTVVMKMVRENFALATINVKAVTSELQQETDDSVKKSIERAMEPYREVIQRIHQLVLDIHAIQDKQETVYRRINALEQQSRSAESLLDEFERTIKRRGQTLRAWLAEIGAPGRYQSIVMLRARRKKR